MMLETVFRCPNIKCAYAIASTSLNELQLKLLRRTAKNAPAAKHCSALRSRRAFQIYKPKQQSLMEGHSMKILLNKIAGLYLRLRVKDAGQMGTLGIDGKVTW